MYPALFVFDMVGTTVEPSDAIPEAFRSAFGDVGIALTDAQIAAVRGMSKREAIADLLALHQRKDEDGRAGKEVYEDFQDRLKAYYRGGNVTPIAGAADTFEWCRSTGARMALTTGFDRDIAAMLLASLGWTQSIDALVCNEDVPHGRPAPFLIEKSMELTGIDSVERVASIGDTVADLQAGANAGVRWNIGVLTGAHERERLAAVADAIIIDSVADLAGIDWQ